MKKIIIFTLCIIFTFSIIPFSAFAEVEEHTDFVIHAGEYIGNDVINVAPLEMAMPFELHFTVDDKLHFYNFTFTSDGMLGYTDTTWSDTYWVYGYQNTGWTEPYNIITVVGDTTVSRAQYVWFFANFKSYNKSCDGSTCPATDVNKDNICDDCGLTFSVLREYADPPSWPLVLPSPPAQYDSFTVVSTGGVYYLYMVDGDVPEINLTLPNANGKVYLQFEIEGDYPEVNIQGYTLIGDTWAYDSVGSMRYFVFDDDDLQIEYSTVDIYQNGVKVFPQPLWNQVQEPVQVGAIRVLSVVLETMGVLAIIVISLIVLSVLLVLFGKRSLLFLKK